MGVGNCLECCGFGFCYLDVVGGFVDWYRGGSVCLDVVWVLVGVG